MLHTIVQKAPEAFYDKEEAYNLLCAKNRSIYVLSHSWQTAEHPDPHGWTLSRVRHFLRGPPQSKGGLPRLHPILAQRWSQWTGRADATFSHHSGASEEAHLMTAQEDDALFIECVALACWHAPFAAS